MKTHRGRGLPWAGTAAGLGALVFLDPRELLPGVLLSVAVHELGHWAVLRGLGAPPKGLTGSLEGLKLEVGPLSWRAELAGALAGPGASLLLSRCLEARWPLGAAVSRFLGLWNLLPLLPLDGGRALLALLTGLAPPGWAETYARLSPWLRLPMLALALALTPRFGLLPLILAGLLALRTGKSS